MTDLHAVDLESVDTTTFDEAVLGADKPVLVEFWAQWCGPCHALAPVLKEIAVQRSDVLDVVKINSDENPLISARYQVMSLPTTMLFHRGELAWSTVGSRPRARLLADVDKALAELPATAR